MIKRQSMDLGGPAEEVGGIAHRERPQAQVGRLADAQVRLHRRPRIVEQILRNLLVKPQLRDQPEELGAQRRRREVLAAQPALRGGGRYTGYPGDLSNGQMPRTTSFIERDGKAGSGPWGWHARFSRRPFSLRKSGERDHRIGWWRIPGHHRVVSPALRTT